MSLSRALRLKDISASHAAIIGRVGPSLDSRVAALAGAQPAITADLKSGQAWVRGAPYALTSLPGWSFTRALAAYGETSAGVLQSFASGAPRLVNGRGQLIEGARTNLCLRSQEFDNASWTKVNCTITADAATAPDGTLTADKIEATTAAATQLHQTATVAATSVAASVYVKKGSGASDANRFVIRNVTTATDLIYGTINYDTGVWSYSVGSSGVTVQTLADGFFRISISTSSGITSGDSIRFYVGFGGASETAGEFAYAWGAQIEAAAFPSSYIPTTTASVTRPADIPLIDISAYSPAITYPLTMYARFERVVDTGGTEVYLALDDGSTNNESLVFVKSTDLAALQVLNGGATQADLSVAGAVAINTATRAAGRIATNDAIIAKGGVLSSQDTSVTNPAAPTTIRLGLRSGGSFACFGYLSEFAIIPGAVSDANLVRLTA